MTSSLARIAIVGFGLAVGTGAVLAQDVTGAGSSFAAPIYSKWAEAYNKATGVRLNYQSIGSGAGLKQVRSKTVDFGASDMPLTDEELAKDGMIQFPTVIGAVVPVVNIKGVAPGQMKLTGAVLADIYLGKITKWDDAAVKALNPGVALPDTAISTVHRADGSGTTYIFTDYLSKVNGDWKSKVGVNTAVNWPNGVGGKGNEGVSSFVQRLPNSIGYVEYAYAKQNKMAFVQMKNAAGVYVEPGAENVKAAAAGAQWSKSFFQMLTNQPGKAAWPISGATFVMMHIVQDKPAQATSVLKFFDWSYAHGDAAAEQLDYVTLPESVKNLIRKEWSDKLKDGAGKTIAFK
ncbi:MAG: phosphate ABC transporter substrate-binding protein PstS [Burkholderiales bacterium]|nr:phosphate ABC transporter substrate-binding protein PstS [Burkholderiales bacterium]